MKKLIPITFALLFISISSFSQDLDSLKLKLTEVPLGYETSDELECKSIQARIFYENPDIYAALIGTVKKKAFQTFQSNEDSGSVLYFEFEKDFKQTGFLSGLMWGGNKPTKDHPEEFLVKKNLLIIWSLDKESTIKKISKEKVSKLL